MSSCASRDCARANHQRRKLRSAPRRNRRISTTGTANELQALQRQHLVQTAAAQALQVERDILETEGLEAGDEVLVDGRFGQTRDRLRGDFDAGQVAFVIAD